MTPIGAHFDIIHAHKKIRLGSEEKKQLIEESGISIEGVIFHLQSDGLLDDIVVHSSQKEFSRQSVFIVSIEDYAYFVPYIESDNVIFLQTVTPSRKASEQFLREK